MKEDSPILQLTSDFSTRDNTNPYDKDRAQTIREKDPRIVKGIWREASKIIKAHTSKRSCNNVLDIGCGTGRYFNYVHAENLYGLDGSYEMLERARYHWRSSNSKSYEEWASGKSGCKTKLVSNAVMEEDLSDPTFKTFEEASTYRKDPEDPYTYVIVKGREEGGKHLHRLRMRSLSAPVPMFVYEWPPLDPPPSGKGKGPYEELTLIHDDAILFCQRKDYYKKFDYIYSIGTLGLTEITLNYHSLIPLLPLVAASNATISLDLVIEGKSEDEICYREAGIKNLLELMKKQELFKEYDISKDGPIKEGEEATQGSRRVWVTITTPNKS